MQHIHRHIFGIGDRDRAGLAVLRQLEADRGGEIGVAVVLVGDQIAETVAQKAGASVGQLAQLH